MYRATVTEVRYNDDYANSHKFYRTYVMFDDEANDYRVLYNWGRLGSNGQFQVQIAYSEDDARERARSKIDDKRRKGYESFRHDTLEVVPNDLLERAGINTETATPVHTVSEFDVFTSEVDTAIRLATGDTNSQVKAVVIARGLEDKLQQLRTMIMVAESQVETVQMLLSVRMG